jgi:hypothetical protein
VNDVFVVSVESIDGRYWTIMDDREHVESWLLRTIERLTAQGVTTTGSNLYYQPRITQFAKLS